MLFCVDEVCSGGLQGPGEPLLASQPEGCQWLPILGSHSCREENWGLV